MSVCTSISRISEAFGVDVSCRILQFASFAFDASLSDILTGLLNGAKICIPSDDERRDDLQAYMHREQINLAWLTPTVARMLDPALSSTHLRQLVLIGEAIAQPDVSRWTTAGVTVYNGYGPAEVGIRLSFKHLFECLFFLGRGAGGGRYISTLLLFLSNSGYKTLHSY